MMAAPWLAVYLHLQLQLPAWTGKCLKCTYDLTGLTGPVCPECGEPAVGTTEAQKADYAAALRWRWKTIWKIGVVAVLPIVASVMATHV